MTAAINIFLLSSDIVFVETNNLSFVSIILSPIDALHRFKYKYVTLLQIAEW